MSDSNTNNSSINERGPWPPRSSSLQKVAQQLIVSQDANHSSAQSALPIDPEQRVELLFSSETPQGFGNCFTLFKTISKIPVLKARVEACLRARGDNHKKALIDSDPVIFKDILSFLQTGRKPLYFDRATGHDHAKYLALRDDAAYYQLRELVEYVDNQLYKHSIKKKTTVRYLEKGKHEWIGSEIEIVESGSKDPLIKETEVVVE